MRFSVSEKVLFRHCDPANIVFYPRYFEMINDCFEKFFDHIGFPWEDLHRQSAVPTAKIETVFHRPSHHGDILHFNLGLLAIGSTSVTAKVEATSHDGPRLSHTATLVHIDASGKAHRWPDAIRTAMTPYLEILQA